MRTTIVLDDGLVNEAFKLSSAKTKRDLIYQALQEFVESRKRLNLMDLKGQIEFEEGYDYKAMRQEK